MLKKLTLLAAFAFTATAGAADIPASEPTGVAPDIFVQSLYQTKLEFEAVSDEMGRATTDLLILNHFDADLLALYKSTFYVDEPVVHGDVFMMAQEWDTKEVATRTTAQTASTCAIVRATFQIAGQPAQGRLYPQGVQGRLGNRRYRRRTGQHPVLDCRSPPGEEGALTAEGHAVRKKRPRPARVRPSDVSYCGAFSASRTR